MNAPRCTVCGEVPSYGCGLPAFVTFEDDLTGGTLGVDTDELAKDGSWSCDCGEATLSDEDAALLTAALTDVSRRYAPAVDFDLQRCDPCALGNHTGTNGTDGCRGEHVIGGCWCPCREDAAVRDLRAAIGPNCAGGRDCAWLAMADLAHWLVTESAPDDVNRRHAFQGRLDRPCELCGAPDRYAIHEVER